MRTELLVESESHVSETTMRSELSFAKRSSKIRTVLLHLWSVNDVAATSRKCDWTSAMNVKVRIETVHSDSVKGFEMACHEKQSRN